MFDLCRSYFNDIKERAIAPGQTIAEEGQLLVYVSDGAGGIAVQPCAAGAGQKPAGFAITDSLKYATMPMIETVTVPASGPYTVTLKNAGIVNASPRAYNNTASSVMVRDDAADTSGDFGVNTTNGVVTFHSAQAGASVTIQYRYNMTLAQATALFFDRGVNARAQDYFSSVSVGCLEGEVFTSLYDTAVAYTAGAALYCAAGGLVSTAAVGAAIGIVTQVPTAGDLSMNGAAMLGCKFNLPVTT